jgi:hypothetical protein
MSKLQVKINKIVLRAILGAAFQLFWLFLVYHLAFNRGFAAGVQSDSIAIVTGEASNGEPIFCYIENVNE